MIKVVRLGVYAGSFNPFHVGHVNIVQKAERLFDKVILLKACNPDKVLNSDNASATDKLDLRGREIVILEPGKLLTTAITEFEKEGYDVTLIRGLRNGKDLDYEMNQQFYLHNLKPDLKTIMILCDPQYMFISSSGIRAMQTLKGNNAVEYIR